MRQRQMKLLILVSTAVTCMIGVGYEFGIKEKGTNAVVKEGTAANEQQDSIDTSIFIMESSPTPPESFLISGAIKDKFHINLKWNTSNADGYFDKLNVLIASDELPDLIAPLPVDQSKDIGPKGALLPLTPYLSKMPHVKALIEKDNLAYASSLASDGNIYALPAFDKKLNFRYVPTLRTDLLAETGLPKPQTYDDLYRVLSAIKQKHPTSLGIVNMEKTEVFNDYGYNFNTRNGIFYDELQDRWVFGPLNDGYREMMSFFHKLWNENLLDPEFFTASQQQWESKVLSGNAAFWLSWPEYAYKYEELYRNAHLGSLFKAAPIDPMTTHTYNKKVVQGEFQTNTWTTIAVSAKTKHIDRILKLVDWMYSDEGSTSLQYGIEGQTYSVVDGKKKFIPSIRRGYNPKGDKDPSTLGIGESGNLLLRVIRDDEYQDSPEYQQETESVLNSYRKNNYYQLNNKGMSLTFTDQELAEKTSLETDLGSFVAESAVQFVTGEKSMGEYNGFLRELKLRGAYKLQDIYNEAYKRFRDSLQKTQ